MAELIRLAIAPLPIHPDLAEDHYTVLDATGEIVQQYSVQRVDGKLYRTVSIRQPKCSEYHDLLMHVQCWLAVIGGGVIVCCLFYLLSLGICKTFEQQSHAQAEVVNRA